MIISHCHFRKITYYILEMKATFYTIFPVSSAITTNSWVSSIYVHSHRTHQSKYSSIAMETFLDFIKKKKKTFLD